MIFLLHSLLERKVYMVLIKKKTTTNTNELVNHSWLWVYKDVKSLRNHDHIKEGWKSNNRMQIYWSDLPPTGLLLQVSRQDKKFQASRDIIAPACPASASGPPFVWTRKVSRWDPKEIPEPPQAAPLHTLLQVRPSLNLVKLTLSSTSPGSRFLFNYLVFI